MDPSSVPGPVLVTGFGPFLQNAFNPSGAALPEALALLRRAGVDAVGEVLPVSIARAPARLGELIEAAQPAAVLMTGLASGAREFRVERVALNLADFEGPDVDGARPIERPVVSGAPPARFTRADAREAVAVLRREGLPARLSHSAGTYVCNAVYFYVEEALVRSGSGAPSLFLHVPPTEGCGPEAPPATLADCARAVAVLAAWLAGGELLAERVAAVAAARPPGPAGR